MKWYEEAETELAEAWDAIDDAVFKPPFEFSELGVAFVQVGEAILALDERPEDPKEALTEAVEYFDEKYGLAAMLNDLIDIPVVPEFVEGKGIDWVVYKVVVPFAAGILAKTIWK